MKRCDVRADLKTRDIVSEMREDRKERDTCKQGDLVRDEFAKVRSFQRLVVTQPASVRRPATMSARMP